MTREYWVRKAHRYLGLFIGVQILLWTVSGFYFVWNDIEEVRGNHLRTFSSQDLFQGNVADMAGVLDTFRQHSPALQTIKSVELRMLLGEPVYEITYTNGEGLLYQLADARTGELLPMLDESQAIALAQDDFAGQTAILSVELLDTADGHAEYRGRDLPIYRVSMDHPSGTNIYVSARRGLVTARRNNTWRIFDFFWMTHTMDFKARDDFNHMLVKVFSILGLITVLSGFLLWGMSSRLFNKAHPE